jgi:hypothetical protein
VRIHAFTIEGRTWIPEFLIAMTKGEEFAFPVPETRFGSEEGMIMPISMAPRT